MGVGRPDLGEPAWRAFTRLEAGPAQPGGVEVGTALEDARGTSEEDWVWALAGGGERT
jgi:hypothetical protein